MALCGYLKADTTVTISLGPFMDDDDAATEKTGLTIQDTEVFLSKNGGAKANPNDTNDCTEDANGVYRKQLDTTDTNTEGILTVYINVSDALYVRQDYMVVAANVYDSLYAASGTDVLDVNVTEIEGSDPTDQIRDSVVDDSTQIDASQLNTHSAITAAAITDDWETQSQAAPTGFHVNVKEVNGTAQTANDNGADINAILADTGTDGVAVSAAAITAIWNKAMSDLAQGAPSATASVLTAINYLYEVWRNKTTTTATLVTVMKDDGSTGLVKSTISDNATTFTKGEFVSGA